MPLVAQNWWREIGKRRSTERKDCVDDNNHLRHTV